MMKRLMMTVAAVALTTPAFAQTATTETEAPADTMQTAPADGTMAPADGTMAPADGTMAPADGTMATTGHADMHNERMQLSAEHRGVTGSWMMDRSLYTTNEPSTTEWQGTTGGARPDTWNDIGNVSDIVLTTEGELVGYIIDIGGFLGLGTHTVMLERDQVNIAQFDNDIVLATNFTQEELEAMPEFDTDLVMD